MELAGIESGTIADRFEKGLFFFVPTTVKAPIKKGVAGSIDLANKGLDATAGRLVRTLAPDVQPSTDLDSSVHDIPVRREVLNMSGGFEEVWGCV